MKTINSTLKLLKQTWKIVSFYVNLILYNSFYYSNLLNDDGKVLKIKYVQCLMKKDGLHYSPKALERNYIDLLNFLCILFLVFILFLKDTFWFTI